MGGSAGCPARARQSSWVTLDVKFLVWITYGPRARSPTPNKSCMHSPCRTFSQAAGHVGGYSELYPQSCPQAAHSAGGVSAQPVHRAVHTSTRRQSRLAEDCRRRSIEQTWNLGSAVAGLAAVAGADWRARRSHWCYSYWQTQGRSNGVSIAEIVPRGQEFERTPPHDLAAEQCVLGGMMLSKDAFSDVLDVIKCQDYYRPAHQLVHDVVLDLYGRGQPADAVTVAAELTRNGDIARVGGAPYLHTLIASVPTAANAGYYARIVRERAILRRLVEVGTRIVQLGYAGDGNADELVDRAEAEV